MVKSNTVYILDDDDSARKGLSRLLRATGFNVLSFSNVSSFLKGLKPNTSGTLIVDMQIVDMQMPELLVEELVKEIRYREINLDIIVVSSDDDLESKKIAGAIGAIGFFRKPVDGTALIDAINWSIKNHH